MEKIETEIDPGVENSPAFSGSRSPLRMLFFILGMISLILGFAGIFLILLPTTPFMLLAAYCFMRSSRRVYFWMLNNRLFGKILKDYRNREGLPLVIKTGTLIVLWGTLALSAFVFIDRWFIRFILAGVGVGVTVHICWIKTKRRDGNTL